MGVAAAITAALLLHRDTAFNPNLTDTSDIIDFASSWEIFRIVFCSRMMTGLHNVDMASAAMLWINVMSHCASQSEDFQ